MKNRPSEHTPRYRKILETFREADRKIEKWIFHFIDEIEEADQNRDTLQNE